MPTAKTQTLELPNDVIRTLRALAKIDHRTLEQEVAWLADKEKSRCGLAGTSLDEFEREEQAALPPTQPFVPFSVVLMPTPGGVLSFLGALPPELLAQHPKLVAAAAAFMQRAERLTADFQQASATLIAEWNALLATELLGRDAPATRDETDAPAND